MAADVAGPLTVKLRCPVAVRARGTSRVPVAADLVPVVITTSSFVFKISFSNLVTDERMDG